MIDKLMPADHRLILAVRERVPWQVDQPSVVLHSAARNPVGIERISKRVAVILHEVEAREPGTGEEIFSKWKVDLHDCFVRKELYGPTFSLIKRVVKPFAITKSSSLLMGALE